MSIFKKIQCALDKLTLIFCPVDYKKIIEQNQKEMKEKYGLYVEPYSAYYNPFKRRLVIRSNGQLCQAEDMPVGIRYE